MSDKEESNDGQASGDSFLFEYFARSLGLKANPQPKVEELTLAGIAKYINTDQCKNIVTMAGAGISTSAGIPDFRSPDTGLYNNLSSYNLPYPQAIFELNFFQENPKPFFVLAKELMPGAFKPTPCHYFIKMLNDKGKLLRHYTQNIDCLERFAGLDEEKIVEAHGTFYTSHCLQCNKEFTFPWMKEQILADKIPECDAKGCKGVVKPDIVFFGERLPDRFVEHVEKDLKMCDMLIVIGTSLTVMPFSTLANRVPFEAPRLYINLEKGTSVNNPISALMFGGGFQFDAEDNYRDVFKEATCDDGCQELADLLGWGELLKEEVEKEHTKIDKASSVVGAAAKGSIVKNPAGVTDKVTTQSNTDVSSSSTTPKTASLSPETKSPVSSTSTKTPSPSTTTKHPSSQASKKPSQQKL